MPESSPDTPDLTALEAAATPAPWSDEPDIGQFDVHGFPMRATLRTSHWARYGYSDPDAAFIAAARNALPDLIAIAEWVADIDAVSSLSLCSGCYGQRGVGGASADHRDGCPVVLSRKVLGR